MQNPPAEASATRRSPDSPASTCDKNTSSLTSGAVKSRWVYSPPLGALFARRTSVSRMVSLVFDTPPLGAGIFIADGHDATNRQPNPALGTERALWPVATSHPTLAKRVWTRLFAIGLGWRLVQFAKKRTIHQRLDQQHHISTFTGIGTHHGGGQAHRDHSLGDCRPDGAIAKISVRDLISEM
jgi:hypothetical protein